MKAVVEAGIRRLLQRSSNSCSGVHELRALKNCYSSRSSSSARRPSRQPTASNRSSSKTGAASIRQQRVASEIRAVVAVALQQGACNAALLARCGFEIQEVRVYAVCACMCVCVFLSFSNQVCAWRSEFTWISQCGLGEREDWQCLDFVVCDRWRWAEIWEKHLCSGEQCLGCREQ